MNVVRSLERVNDMLTGWRPNACRPSADRPLRRRSSTDKSKSTRRRFWLLAVDAGGTKTTAWLVEIATAHGIASLGRGRSSAGNPTSVGFDESTRAIAEASRQARRAAELAVARRSPARCFRLPARPIRRCAADTSSGRLENGFSRAGGGRVRRAAGAGRGHAPVLRRGNHLRHGIIGIRPLGRRSHCRCGGWGYLLGDEGSGYAIGRAALQLALRRLEAGSEPEPLRRTVLHALGVSSVSELTNSVYKCSDARRRSRRSRHLCDAGRQGRRCRRQQSILDSAAQRPGPIVGRAGRTSSDLLVDPSRWRFRGRAGGVEAMRDSCKAELRINGLDCEIGVVEEPSKDACGWPRASSPARWWSGMISPTGRRLSTSPIDADLAREYATLNSARDRPAADRLLAAGRFRDRERQALRVPHREPGEALGFERVGVQIHLPNAFAPCRNSRRSSA